MEYLNEIEEVAFEPAFGYGYEPDAKKKKKKKAAETEHFKGMKKPLANPVVPLLVSLLFAVLLLVCVLLASFSKKPEVTACAPLSCEDVLAVCEDAAFSNGDV